jgi:metal-responsive CopG/Arc/MetJ family transcriptional regulator
MVEFPQPLYQRAAEVAEEMAVNRSKLIRLALESYLAARQKEKLEQQLAEGYIANAELNRAIAEGFPTSMANRFNAGQMRPGRCY